MLPLLRGGSGGFAFSNNNFYRKNTATFTKRQVERSPQQVVENLRSWFVYHFLFRFFQGQSTGNFESFFIPEDG